MTKLTKKALGRKNLENILDVTEILLNFASQTR